MNNVQIKLFKTIYTFQVSNSETNSKWQVVVAKQATWNSDHFLATFIYVKLALLTLWFTKPSVDISASVSIPVTIAHELAVIYNKNRKVQVFLCLQVCCVYVCTWLW